MPVPLVRAVVEVLGDWRPPVDGIVVVESATRPTLTADLADGLSRYLKVPVVGRYAIVDPDVAPGPGRGQLRPAGRRGRAPVRPPGRRSLTGSGSCWSTTGSVTGWTLTLAARAIRAAGAAEVRPLVLATTS